MPSRRAVGNLPAEITTFIGRRTERAEVKRALSATRLLTLTGFGGVGKTRLAVQAAEDLSRAFPEGVWFVELDTLSNPALLPDVVARTLGMRAHGHDSTIQALAAHLRNRTALLVLDNCEHLLEASALLIDTLLRACPDLRVLATSREPIGMRGETVLSVAPLAVPASGAQDDVGAHEAVQLFVNRAQAACPGFQLTEANRSALVEICRHVDGIPLALELAAVRLRGLSVEDLLAQLSSHLQLLNTGSRSSPERQRTLRGCIQWSHQLCSPGEQRLWELASAFAGGFDVDALEAVCAGEPVVGGSLLETLLSLVDKSIVISEPHGGRTRYRMLEVIRRFGEDRLRESDRQSVVRRRHRDHYARLATEAESHWLGNRQRELIERLTLEHPNFRRALEFCIAEPHESETGLHIAADLRELWLALGALNEGAHWFERLLRDASIPVECHIRALWTAAWLAVVKYDLAAAEPLIAMGTRLARDRDELTRARMTQVAGIYAIFNGDLPQAISLGEQALEVFRAVGDQLQEIRTLIQLEVAYGTAGDTDRALAAFAEAVRLSEKTGDTWFRSYALWKAGAVHWQSGNGDQAVKLLRESLSMKRRTTDELGLAVCLEALACATADRNPRQAAEIIGVADARWETMGVSISNLAWTSPGHDDAVTQLRAALGDEEFELAFQRGRRLSGEEGLDFALAHKRTPETRPANAPTRLTRREQEVAQLVTRGLTNKEIASKLVISQRTAETHVERILAKLGFTSRAQIASWMVGEIPDGLRT